MPQGSGPPPATRHTTDSALLSSPWGLVPGFAVVAVPRGGICDRTVVSCLGHINCKPPMPSVLGIGGVSCRSLQAISSPATGSPHVRPDMPGDTRVTSVTCPRAVFPPPPPCSFSVCLILFLRETRPFVKIKKCQATLCDLAGLRLCSAKSGGMWFGAGGGEKEDNTVCLLFHCRDMLFEATITVVYHICVHVPMSMCVLAPKS